MRTRQMGVPVIADEHEAIVGFDVPRLQRLASRHRKAAGLGVRVADAKDAPGAYVGSVRPDSPAAQAGIEAGDVIEELSGRAVSSAGDLEQIAARRVPGQPTSLMLRRNGERKTIILR